MHETLSTLPWFYKYIILKTRQVLSVYRLCANKNLPPPDAATINYFDVEAVRGYLASADAENRAADEEAEVMMRRAQAYR